IAPRPRLLEAPPEFDGPRTEGIRLLGRRGGVREGRQAIEEFASERLHLLEAGPRLQRGGRTRAADLREPPDHADGDQGAKGEGHQGVKGEEDAPEQAPAAIRRVFRGRHARRLDGAGSRVKAAGGTGGLPAKAQASLAWPQPQSAFSPPASPSAWAQAVQPSAQSQPSPAAFFAQQGFSASFFSLQGQAWPSACEWPGQARTDAGPKSAKAAAIETTI